MVCFIIRTLLLRPGLDYALHSVDRRKLNVRYCGTQTKFHSGVLKIPHQWTILQNPQRAYAILEWELLGKIQACWIKFPNHSHDVGDVEICFLNLFQDTWPMPKVLGLTQGLGNEVLFHIKNKDYNFIRVCDYPDIEVFDSGHLCLLGDFPLTSHNNCEKLSFVKVTPLIFRFDSHDSHASAYLIENVHNDSATLYYDIVRIAYKPPVQWRIGRGAKNADRKLIENFIWETTPFRSERFLELDDTEYNWTNMQTLPLENSRQFLLPVQIAVLNSQKVDGSPNKKRFKLSLKNIQVKGSYFTDETGLPATYNWPQYDAHGFDRIKYTYADLHWFKQYTKSHE